LKRKARGAMRLIVLKEIGQVGRQPAEAPMAKRKPRKEENHLVRQLEKMRRGLEHG